MPRGTGSPAKRHRLCPLRPLALNELAVRHTRSLFNCSGLFGTIVNNLILLDLSQRKPSFPQAPVECGPPDTERPANPTGVPAIRLAGSYESGAIIREPHVGPSGDTSKLDRLRDGLRR